MLPLLGHAQGGAADTARLAEVPARISDYEVAPGVTYHYEKPRPFQWLYHIPRDVGQLPGYAFQRRHVPALVGVVASTAALWVADQRIIDGAQQFGRYVGLKATDSQKSLVDVPLHVAAVNLPLQFNVPDNLNSCFYYLGDGWTHLAIASSFWLYGGTHRDNRALQVSSQLGEAILSTGLVVQTLKHLTGRQSPYLATHNRGNWDLLPAYNTYQHFVPNYDAFPTGHLSTAMATVTVIAENYPEYRFIRPVGYSLMGVLGYAMLNNGVHWASDYPLGIALGYAMAKIAVYHGRTRVGTASRPVGLAPQRAWWRQARLSPFTTGPFTGVAVSWLP
ncbi:hypothetical protein GCM10023172_09580 [Hymenobacter ginsengisoli]|uniref:Phosphatidic acid phosphatase type 2/haloperoxidase domain-containing protein n=1 Tax=Hymenobacter ginsengisoli TaxID=1051626 RepID=A0ABP8Q3I8_9BACT|nr:phosphatase PAP2 family protein [Hymenobacter sp. KCTC 23674]MBO2032468.1 phosphatase PAP2 family protein [Hymenobacter sp. BT559]